MRLQILVPQYKENTGVIKNLLDSIAIQQNVDLQNEVGVIICNDGSNVTIDTDLFRSYPFEVEYHFEKHNGVSATRNKCLEYAKADYVMFCDADDIFYNACGLYILFREMDNGVFDSLVSAFIEETRGPNGEILYVTHPIDSTFVHGKVHNRKFLIDNNIKWKEELTIHEDSYFNTLCQKLAKNLKYCQTPFYLWKWRNDSVCRHDPKYILKTYTNMLDSITCLVDELKKRGLNNDAAIYAASEIYDAYFTMNKNEWINQDNKLYRDAVEKRFKEFYLRYKDDFDSINDRNRLSIIASVKNRKFQEGLMMESITFDDWIEEILKK